MSYSKLPRWAYKKKVAGETCTDCGGTYVLNPKTKKVFCQNKCWLPENFQLKLNYLRK